MRPAPFRPVKILRVITRLNIGGPAQHVVFLTQRMRDDSFSTTLVAGSLGPGDGDMGALAARRGVAVARVPTLGNGSGIVGDAHALLQLYRLVRKERPDIVHLHLLKARGLGGLAAKLAGVPLVVETLHGHLLQGYYGPIKARLILAIERVIGRWIADALIVLSERQRQEILEWRIADDKKVHVVPLGLELERFLVLPSDEGSLRRELGVEESTFVLGAVGRFVPIKGYAVLLQAVHQAAPAMDQRVVAVLVGDGPCRRDLEAEAERLGIRHLVRFLGWRDDMAPLYADFDVVVQPSLSEGTPVSLIEAMATGRPVIASRVGGVPDMVDDGRSGLLVPAGDPAALAEALVRVWRDPDLRRRLGDEARRAVYPRYDISRLVTELGDLYVRLLARGTAPVRGVDLVARTPASDALERPR